jgi:hypothetical protein
MRVFAEYFEESGLAFRRNTILQFGESWDLLGNVVLANPGSAEPMSSVDKNASINLKVFFERYRGKTDFDMDHWYEFSVDSTMLFVGKIFSGEYVSKRIELNGVVQLFNTFNIKNQNLQQAVEQIGVDSEVLFSYGVEKFFHDKPTYFGFSNEVLSNELLRNIAMQIFCGSSDVVRRIYQKEFADNSFYHPMYINRAYNQEHFKRYKDNILLPLVEGA